MNERIKELYRQAHMVREYPEDDPMRGGNPPTVYWGGDHSAERFAELIVRECADVVKWTPSMFPNDAIIKNIKEHFGVEE
jgi:hypothetical protein